jgi:Conserved in the green lineage and diatoms 27
VDYDSLEIAVPADQRPVNELKVIREGWLYKWATLSGAAFATRLLTVFVGMFVVIGGPIAYQSFDPGANLPEFVLAGSLGSLVATTVVTLRIYMGWAYVGERLLSATIEYEVRSPQRCQGRSPLSPVPSDEVAPG